MISGTPVLIFRKAPPCGESKPANIPSGVDPLTPTLFHEEWWLDAATGGNFEIAEARSGPRVVGRLPFALTRRFGLKTIRMPALTYVLGPGLDEGEGSMNTRLLKRLAITRELIEQLPRASWQYVKCHPGIKEAIAFQERGFRTYVQFTYEIAPRPVDLLWQSMRNKTRNVIRRAEERFLVSELADPFELSRFYERNLEARGLRSCLKGAFYRNILSATLERGRGRVLAARDEKGRIVAANFCAWDFGSSYYLLSTRSEDSGNSAASLLLWEAIQDAARRGLVFDLAGLGSRGSILLYSGFGACVASRFVALRATPLARTLNELKLLFSPENCFY